MKFSFIDYVFNKFEAEADGLDKGKVNLLTALNSSWLSFVSTYGFVTFFGIHRSSIFSYTIMIFLCLLFYRPIKFWHICRFLNEVEEADEAELRKRETKKPKKG